MGADQPAAILEARLTCRSPFLGIFGYLTKIFADGRRIAFEAKIKANRDAQTDQNAKTKIEQRLGLHKTSAWPKMLPSRASVGRWVR